MRLHYIVIIYYILTQLVTDNDVWMDLTFLIHFQQNKKQNDKISESVNYAVLNQNVDIMTIKMFTYTVELTILLITY